MGTAVNFTPCGRSMLPYIEGLVVVDTFLTEEPPAWIKRTVKRSASAPPEFPSLIREPPAVAAVVVSSNTRRSVKRFQRRMRQKENRRRGQMTQGAASSSSSA